MMRSLFLFLFVALSVLSCTPKKEEDITLPAKPLGGEFSIQSPYGQVKLSDYRGQLVVLYFGYTFCPDICPTTMSTLSKAIKSLGPAEQEKVHVLFISVDPERDTVERLKNYGSFFHPNVRAISADRKTIDEIAKLYGVSYRINAPEKGKTYYTVDHSTQSFLVNKNGELVEFIQHGSTVGDVANLFKKHL